MGDWATNFIRASARFWLSVYVYGGDGDVFSLRFDCVVHTAFDAKTVVRTTEVLDAPRRNRRDTLLLFAACTLMWTCNSMYLINMPLYIIHELHLPDKLAGVMMGTAAGLEIPTMLIAGYYAKRLGKRFLMMVALAAGLAFYAGLLFLTAPWALLALQLLNAVFIGILAGIGMLYFQDLMPGQAGSATTLFTTAGRTGWIFAGSVAGFIAEFWNYYAVFLFRWFC